MRTAFLTFTLLLLTGWLIRGEADEPGSLPDRQAIAATAQGYATAWYTGDPALMRSVLHPALAKRALLPDRKHGGRVLHEMSAAELIESTGRQKPEWSADKPQRMEVTILDVRGMAASVRLRMDDWVDYMHLVKIGGEWKIINVLWELDPEHLDGDS